jgi:hypothetical protein
MTAAPVICAELQGASSLGISPIGVSPTPNPAAVCITHGFPQGAAPAQRGSKQLIHLPPQQASSGGL